MTSGDRVDVVVVGGGVVGLSVAFELQERGLRVEVVDRGDAEGVATRASAGMLAPVSEVEEVDPEMLALALESVRMYPRFVAAVESASGRSCGFRTDGTLWVAVTRDDELQLEHLRETLELRSLSARALGAEAVLEMEPHLTGRVVGGLLVEGDHQVDPRALAGALEAAVRAGGGDVREGIRVTEISGRPAGGLSLIERNAGGRERERAVEAVVLAAGAWSTEDIVSPVRGLGVRPVKGQLLRLRGASLLRRVVRHPDVYLVPRADGELLVGATVEEMEFDSSITAGVVYDLLRNARRVVPGIYDLALAEACVGFRPAVGDNRPVIGAAGRDGLFVAVGHGRNGVLLAAATARYLAEEIATGRAPRALASFRADRLLPRRAEGGRVAGSERG